MIVLIIDQQCTLMENLKRLEIKLKKERQSYISKTVDALFSGYAPVICRDTLDIAGL